MMWLSPLQCATCNHGPLYTTEEIVMHHIYDCPAQGIEAGTGETTKIGSTRRAKARSEGCAPNRSEN
jgi:hypothetical protein